MAYQNVGTPRFYIDIPTYINSLGLPIANQVVDNELLTLDPSSSKKLFVQSSTDASFSVNLGNNNNYIFEDFCNANNLYVAVLNHNLGSTCGFIFNEGVSNIVNILNETDINTAQTGSSIITYSDNGVATVGVSVTVQAGAEEISAGAFSFGSYYDMPKTPELKINMSIEFDGYDSVKTLGGSTLTNVRYAGSPWWYDKNNNKSEPFSVGESNGLSKRNGRRNWTLKFSYISDTDLFSSNSMSSYHIENDANYDSGDIKADNTFEYNVNNDDSFISQVLNKVGNGQRFIFQPDNTNNNPDQFAICMLDQNSLSIQQVAYNVYDISLKIREVW